MDERRLKEFFNKIENDKTNNYSSNIDINLIEVAKIELKKLNIPFERDTKSSNVLQLYSETPKPLRYVKGFYPNNTRFGKMICQDKYLTQSFLEFSNVKAPIGKRFKSNEYEQAVEFIKNQESKKFVLKPTSMSMSLGTYLNVNVSNLEQSWKGSFEVQNKYKVEQPAVLIQEQIQGLELRILVVEGEVGSAIFRAPGYVKGDGKSSIKQLIQAKNKEREKHNYLKRNPLVINDNLVNELVSKNLDLSSVLDQDEYCILYSQSNIATGREMYEVSKYLDNNIFKQALDAVTAIPGVHTAGVDIFVEDLNASEGTIIEVNLNPALQLHYFPMTGKITNPLYDIFEYYELDKNILNDDLTLDNITQHEFSMLKERYTYLYNKEKSLSNSFKMFLDL